MIIRDITYTRISDSEFVILYSEQFSGSLSTDIRKRIEKIYANDDSENK